MSLLPLRTNLPESGSLASVSDRLIGVPARRSHSTFGCDTCADRRHDG